MLLDVQNITKRYDAIDGVESPAVLDGVSLTLDAGESLSIVGPSGCGKSTLLNIIGTLDQPTSGKVLLKERDLSSMNERELAVVRHSEIGFIFQDHHLLPQCTVVENVLVPTLPGVASDEPADVRAKRLLERVGLADRLHHRPGQLSGGQRQRVAVVRALINQPALLLADEPTGALDRASADNLSQLLVDLNGEEGVTLIVVTHAPTLAGMMAKAVTLEDGRIAEQGGAAVEA